MLNVIISNLKTLDNNNSKSNKVNINEIKKLTSQKEDEKIFCKKDNGDKFNFKKKIS